MKYLTLEEKEKRERAEEIEKFVWNQVIYADLRANKKSEASVEEI